MQSNPLPVPVRSTGLDNVRLVFDIFKLRIGFAIGFTALAGLAVTPGPSLAVWQVAALGIALTLTSAAAGAFNQLVERDIDARMRRTRERAFVTGRLHAGVGWLGAILALGACGVALAAFALNALTAVYALAGALTYAVVYTVWLKRRSWWNIVVGGLAGSFAVLAGGAAAAPGALEPVTLAFAFILFLWTPPHFWSLAIAFREDYAAANVPMLPVVVGPARAARMVLQSAALLVAASFMPALLGVGWVYLATAAVAGAYLLRKSVQLARHPERRAAMANFHASLVYLALLLGAAIVDAAVQT